MPITNDKLKKYPFLKEMFEDDFYPNFLVEKARQILIHLCEDIEAEHPANDAGLFELTHAAVEEFNDLEPDFQENDSEFEAGAREAIEADFAFIVKAYGFDVDLEDVLEPRNW